MTTKEPTRAEVRRFRERSADRLHQIANLLDNWLDDWQEGEFAHDTLAPPEYPFTEALEDLIANVHRSVELLSREVCECGGYEDEHAYDCAHYEPKHRADEPMTLIPQREHVDVLQARAVATSGVELARLHLHRMVAAFDGGYHPDTTQYVRLPIDYTQERVDEVEGIARALGLDLYAEALAVTQEALWT